MELRDGGTMIGDVGLTWLSERRQQGEIGFVVHPDFHGRGLAREGATEILRLGFEHFGLHRVIGRCDPRNEASARLMRRLGMRQEAHFVQNEIFKGDWGDELVFAMLAAEWADLD
jgi:RimJ/RimL family protein N-acetyltransferase